MSIADRTKSGDLAQPTARIELAPHRSMSTLGRRLVIGVFALGAALTVLRSAPALHLPLVIAQLLTVIALWSAFYLNNRAARFCETIEISPDEVVASRAGPSLQPSEQQTVTFNPYWLRIDVSSDRHVENRITLRQSDRCFSLGEFLAPAERKHIAEDLRSRIRIITSMSSPTINDSTGKRHAPGADKGAAS